MSSRLGRRWYLLLTVPIAIVAGLLLFGEGESTKPVRYVAYIGRYTNLKDTVPVERQERNRFDMLHEIVLREYLDRLNDSLASIRLELKTFDNGRDPAVSDSIYRNLIARDSSIVLVIDNTWGEHIQPCAEAIRENRIPVISINADRNNRDFGPTALFTGNDDDAPIDIVTYLAEALKVGRINLISETDYPLHETFMSELAASGITTGMLFEIEGKKELTPEIESTLLERLRAFYREHPAEVATPLLINTHHRWGDRILGFIEEEMNGLTVIGGAYMSSTGVVNDFGKKSGNEMIVMSRPTDALPKEIYNDLEGFRAEHPIYFDSPSAPYFIKRCLTVAEIIAEHLRPNDSVPMRRADFSTFFEGLRGKALTGEYDLYEFDTTHVLLKDVYFAKNRGGTYYSLPTQLNRQRARIPNIFFGIDVLDIYDIDINANTFKSDFFYWVKVDTGFHEAEKFIVFQNLQENNSSRQMVIEKRDGGTLYRLYKVSGVFHHDYELRDFPFDRQELAITVEILNPSDKLKISFDQSSLDQDGRIFERFKVRAWNKLRYYVTVDNRITSTLRGDPEQEENRATIFKSFAFRLLVQRKFAGPFLEIVLPLALIGFVAISLLYVKDISFENLGEVSVGTFLGIITFSIALSYVTPSSDYLTKADFLFWTTFVVVLVSFLTVIVVNSRYSIHDLEGVSIRPVRYAMTILYPIVILLLMWL